MASLKTLQIRALKATIIYLESTIAKLKDELCIRRNHEDVIRGLEHKLKVAEARRAESSIYIECIQKRPMEILSKLPIEHILVFDELINQFYDAIRDGQHIAAIKLLRNSNKLGMGLKEAKDLYELKYRNWEKYPKQG